MNPALAFSIIAGALALAGFAFGFANTDHTAKVENETDRAMYTALLGRLSLLCREAAVQVNTLETCLWVKVGAGSGKSFYFYTSAAPSCSPENVIQVNFLPDYLSIEIIAPGGQSNISRARFVVAEVDKYLANTGMKCAPNQ